MNSVVGLKIATQKDRHCDENRDLLDKGNKIKVNQD